MTLRDNNTPRIETPEQLEADVARLRRRRLVTGAGAGFMVLGSRSVLGKECYNPSETLSGARSHTGGDLPQCNGESAGIWWQAAKRGGMHGGVNWFGIPGLPGNPPDKSKPWDTPFHAIFPGEVFGSKSLLEVLGAHQGGGDLPSNLGFHIVAALLNIRAGLVDERAVTEFYLVHTIWGGYIAGGYSPTPVSPIWSEAEIVSYLTSTGIVK
ncbi:MAG TPA: hypothetical protein PLR02_01615 [Rhodocyclaceae bacterium]|nr:hypothetical protein [Rhodocyclaceae bacterium]